MGSELGSEYYDKVFKEDKKYNCHFTESPFYGVWKQLALYIPEESSIVDLGCGPGQFAEMLYEMDKFVDYYGIDFSKVAIKMAKENDFDGFEFKRDDLRTCKIPEADVYVACEVLEHIMDDLELLERLPKGKLIVGSVPVYDSAGHVRYFEDWKKVKERYEDLIDIETIGMFANIIYFFKGELR